jgi:hypothetical protein
MMFQGSQNVGKSEHFSLVENVGGIVNGTTNADRTNYFQAVPSNQLEMILFLEADRMRGLEIHRKMWTTSATPCRKNAVCVWTTRLTANRTKCSTS